MIKFIQEAMKEIEHVTWPTKAETKKYFSIVTTMIIVWAIVLAVFGFIFTESMFAIRKITPHEVATPMNTSLDSSLLNSLNGIEDVSVSGAAEPSSPTGTSTGTSN